jgi:hypothetical protein
MTAAERAGFGPFLSAIGAALLGVSVFFPWYSLTLTSSGAASAQQAFNSAAQQYGNSALQAEANSVSANFGAIAGRQLATVSGHQLLKDLSAVLLVLAAVAFIGALCRLAGASAPIQVDGRQIALVGVAATLCVMFRMLELPGAQQEFISLGLSWGIWLALASSIAILVGGLWPSTGDRAPVSATAVPTDAHAEPALPDLDAYWRA